MKLLIEINLLIIFTNWIFACCIFLWMD